jgi:hypothetical protein
VKVWGVDEAVKVKLDGVKVPLFPPSVRVILSVVIPAGVKVKLDEGTSDPVPLDGPASV